LTKKQFPSAVFLEFVLEQLNGMEGLTHRYMFGGYGLYQYGKFFAILYDGRVYFKTNLKSRMPYIQNGMKAFQPNEKQTLKNYFEVPGEILEEPELLISWAHSAVHITIFIKIRIGDI